MIHEEKRLMEEVEFWQKLLHKTDPKYPSYERIGQSLKLAQQRLRQLELRKRCGSRLRQLHH